MKSNKLILIVFLLIYMKPFAQDAKKMSKFLKVTTTGMYNKNATISFDHLTPNKHGFVEISTMFKNAFIAKKFTLKDSSQYLMVMDYEYGYDIANYRMQYKNFNAQILDLNNNRTVVATIVYKGRFETDSVANAVANELDKTIIPDNVSTPKIKTPNTTPATKTKEERLVELKQLYEKQLITKEEYDEARKKILAE